MTLRVTSRMSRFIHNTPTFIPLYSYNRALGIIFDIICRAEERLGWYEGEEVTVDEWEGLGKREGREHTVRVSWAGNGRTPCINGIDGVAGMQYSPVSKRSSHT